MKKPHLKHIWVDDENHPLKGYPASELEFVDETWRQIINRNFCLIKNWLQKIKLHLK